MNDFIICIDDRGSAGCLTEHKTYEVLGYFAPNKDYVMLKNDNRNNGKQEWYSKRFKLLTDDNHHNNINECEKILQELYDDPIQICPKGKVKGVSKTPTTST